jgi:hypothetical protein
MKDVNKIPHYTISELTDGSDETDVKPLISLSYYSFHAM